MLTEDKKTFVNDAVKSADSTLKIGVYAIYDCVLKQYDIPISIPVSKLYDYMNLLVNDVQNKYYGHEVDFILNKIGDFDIDTGEFKEHFIQRISTLDKYIDSEKRRLQTIVQVLNYLPSGYYKMPVEQKQAIQEKIDKATMEYVANYVLPDLDVSKFDTNKVMDIYKRYDSYSHLLKIDTNGRIIDDLVGGIGAPFYNDET